jgi:ABC-2 type transport system ATP-binding protein
MIEVVGLTKFYGEVKALDDVSFDVRKGEILGFLGPNGAGKTTTMRILTGFLSPTYGTAKVAGYDVVENSLEVRRITGYLPETVPLYNEMRVSEYLGYMARIRGIPRKKIRDRVDYVDRAMWAKGGCGPNHWALCQRVTAKGSVSLKPLSMTRKCSFWTNPPSGLIPSKCARCANS